MNKKSEEQLNDYVEELKAKLEAAEEKAQAATERAEHLELQMKDDNLGWSLPRHMKRNELPLPRLELHWERDDELGYTVRCTYMLVYEHFLGIKGLAGPGDAEVIGIPFGQTKRSGSPQVTFVEHFPFQSVHQITTPRHEWAHATSDAAQLKLPLYITTCDGDMSIVEGVEDLKNVNQRMLKVGNKAL